jgi:hypothetical protein
MVEPLSSVPGRVPGCRPNVAGARLRGLCGFSDSVVRTRSPLPRLRNEVRSRHKMRHVAESSMSQLIVLEAIFGSIVLLLVGLVRAVDQ